MNPLSLTISKPGIKTTIIDALAVGVIFLTPPLSHLTSIPFYLLEPMRIMLFAGMLHTSRKNGYLLAIMLPLFSLFISLHPSAVKTLLIASELSLNVLFFGLLYNRFRKGFAAVLISILISKLYYYSTKFGLITAGLMEGELISTPIYLQAFVVCALSIYGYFVLDSKEK